MSEIVGDFHEEMERRDAEKEIALRQLRDNPASCFYCGVKMTEPRAHSHRITDRTRDHVEPKSLGGEQTISACRGCNGEKGGLTFDEYRVLSAFRRGLLDASLISYKFHGER